MADKSMRQGGAEDFVRSRQYEYGQNSNLVLEADRETRRRNDEGTGEVESLVGKMGSRRMGDKVQRGRPPELEARVEKLRKKRKGTGDDGEEKKSKKKRSTFGAGLGSTVLTETEEMDSISYRPKTKESRAAYEQILSFVQDSIGAQPQDMARPPAEQTSRERIVANFGAAEE